MLYNGDQSIFLSLSLSISVCLYVSLSVCLPACLSVCLSVSMSPSLCLSVSPCVSLYLCLFFSLSLSVFHHSLSVCLCLALLHCGTYFKPSRYTVLFTHAKACRQVTWVSSTTHCLSVYVSRCYAVEHISNLHDTQSCSLMLKRVGRLRGYLQQHT